MNFTLLQGDCLEQLKRLDNNSIDSIVTDPPYGLSFMGKKWDYDVPSVEVWEECLRVLKPGGHLLSFSSARTYHRMVVNVEDAGFEIRDQIMWVYGSGFPKSHNIGKSVDKLLGNKREVVGKNPNHRESDALFELGFQGGKGDGDITKGQSKWEGWGTALKPAHEPIVLARKPLANTVAKNVLEYGTGGINIDKSKCEGDRFPANFIHDGSQLVLDLFPDTKSTKSNLPKGTGGIWSNKTNTPCGDTYSDEGSAARFFYCAKTSKKERGSDNNHPTVKPQKLMSYLINLVTPPGGAVLDPFMGSGSTGVAAIQDGYTFFGCEMDEDYLLIAKQRITNEQNYYYQRSRIQP